ncbi:class I SAM-dependent methyltransferase [Mesohalobacter salilacus]|uniref:class I SAM-dependent methyltransferase n=1 Tax=Mesohalobacter salilacus TaxID=2491711 RepID=UPI002689B287
MSLDKNILHPDVIEFIKQHENHDIPKLILKGSPFKSISIQHIAQQIKGRQVAKTKFPQLYDCSTIIYPPKLNLEQSSSEVAANYKTQFVNTDDKVIDITGGMGVDTLAFAQKSNCVTYCEIQSKTFEYAQHNFKSHNPEIKLYLTDGIAFLKQNKTQYDLIYVDPARRNQHQKKVFRLEDSAPNVLEYLDLFQSKSNRVLIKTSPLLDLKYCLNKIVFVAEIHIVAIKNEVKEILILIDFNSAKRAPVLKAVNLESDQKSFQGQSTLLDESPKISEPKTYLYEPNAAIMKSGLFGELSTQFNLTALAKNTHLFTSNDLVDFPGRRFKIKSIVSPKKKDLKKHIPHLKANVSSRNYPLKPEQIKAKYQIQDGGDCYAFFVSDFKNQKIVLICHKI